MITVGVRELKDHLSEYLRKVQAGERVVVTDRGRPVASIAAAGEKDSTAGAWELVLQGRANWSGGKPDGCRNAPRPSEGEVGEAVLEDRR